MYKYVFVFFTMLIFISCPGVLQEAGSSASPADSSTVEKPSLVRKWYYNSEDDRYYYDFKSNGALYRRYYNTIFDQFQIEVGDWHYLNDEHTSFSVGWDGTVDRYYNIVEEDSDKLIVEKDDTGPMGRGLGSNTVLLKSAKTITYTNTIPDEISDLIDTWYYDESKIGKYLRFYEDGTCIYHYYQDFGGMLTGWVNISGSWSYSTDSQILKITMSGEISYSYSIDELSDTNFKYSLADGHTTAHSMIYTESRLFK